MEKDPAEVELRSPQTDVEILQPRDVPLGGPRAMSVRRTLPQKARSLIGAWCFVDHYGREGVVGDSAMFVPPHPHTGLQTVSWLFSGEIEHRDSIGTHALVRAGELNLMTAGAGIQHSEVGTGRVAVTHGAQLWVALPDAARLGDPEFDHFVPEPFEWEGATVRVFLGSLLGRSSPARTFTPLLGAQLDLPANTEIAIPVEPSFEHGVLVDAGAPSVNGHPVARDQLAYFPTGGDTLTIASGDGSLRALLLGGEPLGERILMWWNFIGRTHEEVVEFRRRWQAEVVEDADRAGLFGHIDGYEGGPLPAPELPNVRLRPRD